MSIERNIKQRTYDTRLICIGLSYSVQEIAELYGLHKNAVLRWIKGGLPVIDDKKPYLIHGSELVAYLKNKQQGRKRKCQPDEFFCCKCRAPRKALENLADITIRNEIKLSISGLCAVCNTQMHRVGTVKKLAEYQKIFLIRTIQGQHITECHSPIVMCDSRKETET